MRTRSGTRIVDDKENVAMVNRTRSKLTAAKPSNASKRGIKREVLGCLNSNKADSGNQNDSSMLNFKGITTRASRSKNVTMESQVDDVVANPPPAKLRKVQECKTLPIEITTEEAPPKGRPERTANVKAGVRLSYIRQYEKGKLSKEEMAELGSSNVSHISTESTDEQSISSQTSLSSIESVLSTGAHSSSSDSSSSTADSNKATDIDRIIDEAIKEIENSGKPHIIKAKEATPVSPRKSNKRVAMQLELAENATSFEHQKMLDEQVMEIEFVYRNTRVYLPYDKRNMFETHLNTHYTQDIFSYLKAHEVDFPSTDYFKNGSQPNLSSSMRIILNDWLIELQEILEISHETIYLGVKICDQYLMKKPITRNRYQLLGVTCLFIACKFDERLPPAMVDFLALCDGVYTERELRRMEIDILTTLDYNLSFPLSYRFLRRYSNIQGNSFHILCMARYILECSLLMAEFISISESLLGAASLMLAHLMLKSGSWDEEVRYASGYERDELVPLMRRLSASVAKVEGIRDRTMNVVRKYKNQLFCEVAKVELLPKHLIV